MDKDFPRTRQKNNVINQKQARMTHVNITSRKLFLILFLLVLPIVIKAEQKGLEEQLRKVIANKKAQIGIAVIINSKDTITINNDARYPMMSVFKLHQALAVADYCEKKGLSFDTSIYIRKADLKTDTYSPLRDLYPDGEISLPIKELLEYTLHLSDNNACDILFNYQGGPDSVNRYIQSLGIRDCEITHTENDMHEDLDLCYSNWSTPLAAAKLLEIFRRKTLFDEAYKDFIYQTMVECQTGQDRLVAPLLGKGVTVGHKTGTGDFNAKGQQIGCNDIGFVLLPNGHAYSIAVFVKDSAESSLENSKIIADISRIVYKYVIRTTK